MTPKHIPTEAIVSSVEAVLSRQRELSESAKDNIRSRIASTIQSSSLTDSNLTKDERQALKRLKTDENIVILPADKGRVTVVMDKTDYYDKMDTLVRVPRLRPAARKQSFLYPRDTTWPPSDKGLLAVKLL